MSQKAPPNLGEVILEFTTIGNSVKVSAIQVSSGQEVSIVGPANGNQKELERTALAKLDYVLRKKSGKGKKDGLIA